MVFEYQIISNVAEKLPPPVFYFSVAAADLFYYNNTVDTAADLFG